MAFPSDSQHFKRTRVTQCAVSSIGWEFTLILGTSKAIKPQQEWRTLDILTILSHTISIYYKCPCPRHMVLVIVEIQRWITQILHFSPQEAYNPTEFKWGVSDSLSCFLLISWKFEAWISYTHKQQQWQCITEVLYARLFQTGPFVREADTGKEVTVFHYIMLHQKNPPNST